MAINKVAVIGAGVMGAAIAAQLTNAGVPVYLLDIVPEQATNRNIVAETAIQKLLKAEPAAFMHKNNARLITPGNIEDHLSLLADVDWVIEAIVEKPQVKQALYKKLVAVCHKDCVISSNTSTLPLSVLVDGLPESFAAQFMITHFFNPPRYMRLLELVTSPKTRPELISTVQHFADIALGKNCVLCKDTPGFIANRIGIFWLQCGILEAIELGLTVEQADNIIAAPFGIPKTGIFGLLDLIGLDLIPPILSSMTRALPAEDAFQPISQLPTRIQDMIAAGLTGRKGKGGFYRLNAERIKESIDLNTGEYSASHKPKTIKETNLQAVLSSSDKESQYAWRVLSKTLAYTASLVPEIADDIVTIDAAMRDGYNWTLGPFELLDQIGVDWFVEKLQAEQRLVPPLLWKKQALYLVNSGQLHFATLTGLYQPIRRDPGLLTLVDMKRQHSSLLSNDSASLWDIGDGVACLEFHSKMNTLDMDSMALIRQSIDKVKNAFTALVIHNEGEHFSAGANLGLLVQAIHNQDWAAVEQLIIQGQQTYKALKYAPFPVVAAPSGLALGGGCEILLHCDAVQAHAELYMGLVEVGVGLIPGWGGCKEYLRRWLMFPKLPKGPIPPVVKAFETIGLAKVSKSAVEAKELLFLSHTDGITMNKSRLLADAKRKALSLCNNYTPPQPCVYALPGKTAEVLLGMSTRSLHAQGKATPYDLTIAAQLAYVLSGGDCDMTEPLSEDDMLALELNAFVTLVKQPNTLARLEHMLKTGKPLRN
ncbi:3-hydroxyacyl-CoA dehydrogenase [Crenothrix polyspora]|uniref:3-hydroxyacyl-CoA dehydrogenase n=1 Tax=Crenothrix polyspora TaxID=360316 RepID=A0A1R4H676_9GAMM|nr:3-hydroxyacyl-CoA dehydrogenase/enoyl-CoA hydratase family protein [Crenothrix polyspora]SJM91778.1 3-hydroxyacyl-CoA dehydrogenase [Crenothrix polyspora]